jgi:hypothetical protein
MDTYYCVKEPGECRGQCDICPVQEQLEFDFMKDRVADDVNHPDHYTMGGIEVFDFINSWQLSFPEGNVVKYVVRAPYKGSQLKDLKKARWYLDQLIKDAERDND